MYDPILTNLINPTRSPPVTWGEDGELNLKTLQKIEEINARMRKNGYTVKMGSEQEFELFPIDYKWYKPGTTELTDEKRAWIEEKRNELAIALFYETSPADHNKPEYLAKQEAIKHFSPQELLMLELHGQCDDILAPKFGKSKAGDGYYDVHGVLEVDIKPQNPIDAVKNHRLLLRTLEEKAEEYGFGASYHTRHLTMSAYHPEHGHIMDIKDGTMDKRAQNLAAGVLKCAYEALPCLARRHTLQNRLAGSELTAGAERVNPVKIRPGKKEGEGVIELRLNDNAISGGHFATAVLTMLTGMDYGLNYAHDHARDEVLPVTTLTRPVMHTPNKEMFFVAEILSAADIGADGKITMTKRNIKQVAEYHWHLAKEIGFPMPHGKNVTDVSKLAKILGELKVEGDHLTWEPGSYFDQHPELHAKLQRIRLHDELQLTSLKGYKVLDPEAQVEHMHQSKPLREIWGDELLDGVSKAHANALKIQWPPRSEGEGEGLGKPSLAL